MRGEGVIAKEITNMYCPFGLLRVNLTKLEHLYKLQSLNLDNMFNSTGSTATNLLMRLAHTITYVHACSLLVCTLWALHTRLHIPPTSLLCFLAPSLCILSSKYRTTSIHSPKDPSIADARKTQLKLSPHPGQRVR
jgi:hypothetical protein